MGKQGDQQSDNLHFRFRSNKTQLIRKPVDLYTTTVILRYLFYYTVWY